MGFLPQILNLKLELELELEWRWTTSFVKLTLL